MKHTFNLVYPNKEVFPVRLVVSHNGEKFRKSVGVSVKTKIGNQKARTADKMCKDVDAWAKLGPIHAKLIDKEVSAHRRSDVLSAIRYALEEVMSAFEDVLDKFAEVAA